MKDTKKEQLLWLIVSTLFIAGMIYFVKDTGTTSALAATFTTIVGIFIGLDIAVMIKKTSAMSNGDFKSINKSRYITAFAIFSFLLLESFFISATQNRNWESGSLSLSADLSPGSKEIKLQRKGGRKPQSPNNNLRRRKIKS